MVAAGLRIRQPHLAALESGRIDLLPGNAYAVGFLRAYAAALGLDPDEIARRFKAEAAEVNRRTELEFPAPLPERGMPAGALVLLGVVLAIGAYAGWYRLSGDGKLPAETVIPVPHHLAPLALQAAPPLAAPPMLAVAGQSTPAAPPLAAPALLAAQSAPPATATAKFAAATPAADSATAVPPPGTPAPPVTAAPQSAGPAGPASPPAAPAPATMALDATPPVPSVSPTSAAAAPMPPMSVLQPAAAATDQIMIRATADAWLEVRDAGGNVLLNRVLHAGDTWTVPEQAGLVLTTGNAGGTVLVVDGVSSPALGGAGSVRRDLPLDPALIKQGRLAPAAAAAQQVSVRTAGQ